MWLARLPSYTIGQQEFYQNGLYFSVIFKGKALLL